MVSLDVLYSGPSHKIYIKSECLRLKTLERSFSSSWSITKKFENSKVENWVSNSPSMSCLLSTCYFLVFYSLLVTTFLLATGVIGLTNIFLKSFRNLAFSAWNFTEKETPSRVFLGMLCEFLKHLFYILFRLQKTCFIMQ